MPILATKGAASVQGFGFAGGGASFICATGGTVVDCGDFRTHIFTGPGSFVVNKAPSAPTKTVDYLVVAGGGGGGSARGGGAGAGGFRLSNSLGLPAPLTSPLSNPAGINVTAQSYPITVGGGGTRGLQPTPLTGGTGNPAVFSTITSAGGGGGGGDGPAGGAGGSGGGGGESSVGSCKGSGNTPPVSPPQGNPGGYGTACGPHPATGAPYAGGGGGGAAARGNNACGAENFRYGGQGGSGSYIADSFVGPTAPTYGTSGPVANTRYFAGGGSGNSCNIGNPGATVPGGTGGGAPSSSSSGNAPSGTTNTGGGGAGAGTSPASGGLGGSGIVMIRYKYK